MALRFLISVMCLGLLAACPTSSTGTPGSSSTSSSSSSSGASGGGADAGATSGPATSRPASSRPPSSSSVEQPACPIEGGDCIDDANSYGLCCGGVCVSRLESPNCGACGVSCQGAERCAAGECLTESCNGNSTYCLTADGGINTCCGSECVNTHASDDHCGRCFEDCAAHESCGEGECRTSDCTFPGTAGDTCFRDGQYGLCCGDNCINIWADALNCGGCGSQCPAGGMCNSGSNLCISEASTAVTCTADGGCGADLTCVGALRCIKATCAAEGEKGFACALPGILDHSGNCCGNGCADTRWDDANCGVCGNVCGANSYCLFGTCTVRPVCNTTNNGTTCPAAGGGVGVCCNNACVDTSSTNEHCGTCGASCPTDNTCENSQCRTPDGGSGYCVASESCPTGLTCVAGKCSREECGAGVTGVKCAFGGVNAAGTGMGTCCGGDCVDVAQDGDHCGACGTDCPGDGLCAGSFGLGMCLPEGQGSQCTTTCFGETQLCVQGYCVEAACAGPFGTCRAVGDEVGTCCSQVFSAFCANVKTDAENCGSCGARCAEGQACVHGTCQGVEAPCGAGNLGRFCDTADDGGTRSVCCASGCADLSVDEGNCGRCGNVCAGAQQCLEGRCAVVSCQGLPDNSACFDGLDFGTCCGGACVSLVTDETNCGQCARRCPASATCQRSTCGVSTCTPEVAGSTCFANDTTGRCCGLECVNTATDVRHCSGCGLACNPDEMCINSGCRDM